MAKFCVNCGEKVSPEWRVCPECGTPLVQGSPDLEQPIREIQPYPPPRQVLKQESLVEKSKGNLLEKASHIVPFVGGVIILVALFTPAAWFHRNILGFDVEYDYIWIFGLELYYWWETGLEVRYLPNMVGGIPSILIWTCSILMLLGSISIIVISRMIKRRKMKSDNLVLGLIIIIILSVTILWMVLMELNLNILFASNRFWGIAFPGFGVIGIFLGILVILIGIGFNIKVKKRIQKKKIRTIKSPRS